MLPTCASSRILGLSQAVPMTVLYLAQCVVSARLYGKDKEAFTGRVCRALGFVAAFLELLLHIDAHTTYCSYGIMSPLFTRFLRFNIGGLTNAALIVWVYVAVNSLERARLSHYNGGVLKTVALTLVVVYPILANLSFILAIVVREHGFWTWSIHAAFSIISNVLVISRLLVAYCQLSAILTVAVNADMLTKKSTEHTLKTIKRYRTFTVLCTFGSIVRVVTYCKKVYEIISDPFKKAQISAPVSPYFDIMHTVYMIWLATFLWFFWIPMECSRR
eukprot:774817_1